MLLMSEKTDSMTSCRELMEATKLNLDHFQKYVQSVFESKLLTVTVGSGEVFEPSTVIMVNMDYNNKNQVPYYDCRSEGGRARNGTNSLFRRRGQKTVSPGIKKISFQYVLANCSHLLLFPP